MKKFLVSLLTICLLMTLTSCGDTSLGNKNDNNIKENDITSSSKLTENIITHIEEWEYACDSFTQNYTYDDVETTGICLYSADKKGEYYFEALYTMPSDGVHATTTYHRIYYITDSTFQYVYGSEYSADDETVKNYRVLAMQFPSKNSDKTEYVEKMVNEGLSAEDKYLNEIHLNETDTIVLTDEQNLLFNNMYNAIKELEYYEPNYSGYRPQVPLAKIEYYNLGNGTCEVLLYHGYTGENIVSSFFEGGYLIDENGYSRLSYDDEEKLENTSNTSKIEWNVDWTEEKKEYVLKKAIYENG